MGLDSRARPSGGLLWGQPLFVRAEQFHHVQGPHQRERIRSIFLGIADVFGLDPGLVRFCSVVRIGSLAWFRAHRFTRPIVQLCAHEILDISPKGLD